LVGADGVARVLDFGIAKAVGRMQATHDGQVKGKAAYMAPEQVRGWTVDRRTDVYACFVVLWEALTGERLFASDTPVGAMAAVLEREVTAPSEHVPSLPSAIDAVVLRGLARRPEDRYADARTALAALEAVVHAAGPQEVASRVRFLASDVLEERTMQVVELER